MKDNRLHYPLKVKIPKAHEKSQETYGSRRIQAELAERGTMVGRDHIGRLREEMGLACKQERKGNCYDHAPTESRWGCLKQELVHHRRFAKRAEATASIQEYIEIFYDRVRRHSSIGNVAPSRYAESFCI